MSRSNVQTLITGIADGGNNSAAEVRDLLTAMLALIPASGNAVVNASQNLNTTLNAALTAGTSDDNWSTNGTTMSYTGSPDYVILIATVELITDGTAGIKPRLRIRRNNSSSIGLASAVDPGAGNRQSVTIASVDVAPGVNPSYVLACNAEGAAGTSEVVIGRISCTAVGG